MKQVFFFFVFAMALSLYPIAMYGQNPSTPPIDFDSGYIDPTLGSELPHPRTPEVAPTIYLVGNTLYFATPCDGCTFQIVDEAENICYELVIPMGRTELELPENLFGEYELRIIRGNTLYYGTININ